MTTTERYEYFFLYGQPVRIEKDIADLINYETDIVRVTHPNGSGEYIDPNHLEQWREGRGPEATPERQWEIAHLNHQERQRRIDELDRTIERTESRTSAAIVLVGLIGFVTVCIAIAAAMG